MSELNDLKALFEQLKNSSSPLSALFGGAPPEGLAERAKALQQKAPNLSADIEATLKKALEVQAEQEAYLKRLRGEEVESDKAKEGDLDTVPDRFEAEYAQKPEEVNALIQSLGQLVERAQPQPAPTTRGWR